MKTQTPRTDDMVAHIKGWSESARARNLAYLCRKLERELETRKLSKYAEWFYKKFHK